MGQAASARAADLVPFDQFYQGVSAATLASQTAKPGAQVIAPAAFEEMRSHVADLYAGVAVKHSFLLDGHPFDCVPIAQQPAVRQLGLKTIATPPDAPGATSDAAPLAQLDKTEATDALGNSTACTDGTIPMRRVTLDDLSRFKTLSEYFQKGPGGAGQAQLPGIGPSVTATHKYAHAYENVANLGGSSFNNLWSPAVNTGLGEIFALSQFWYVNFTGPVQTVEMGLQNYPQKYGVSKSVLFIYWTSDGYNKVGCYNLDCKGFVQTNKNVYLGKGFNNYSTLGGTQYAPQLSAFLTGGNWWLYLNGTAAANAIGYYPASVFHNAPLSKAASEIDYGGEVVGTTIWPPMGSGQFAKKGFRYAAYDHNIIYYPNTSYYSVAKLTAAQPSPSCFTDDLHNASDNSGWGTYFFFGGPGGKGC